jgi:hypothetical protein
LEAENLSNENTDPTNSSLRSYSPHNTTQEKFSLSSQFLSLQVLAAQRKRKKEANKKQPQPRPREKKILWRRASERVER